MLRWSSVRCDLIRENRGGKRHVRGFDSFCLLPGMLLVFRGDTDIWIYSFEQGEKEGASILL